MRSTPARPGRGLQPNVLGTFNTIVMAVAGSAPAYSLAATSAVLVGTVGLGAPAALLYCAIPMLGIALAYRQLGRIDVNAGATTPGSAGPCTRSSVSSAAGRWSSRRPCSWSPDRCPRER